MPPLNNHEGRIATVEADVKNIASDVSEIKDLLKDAARNHVKVMARLAVIESHQVDFKSYQVTCEAVRSKHDKRLTNVEGYQVRQAKLLSLMAAVISVGISAGVEYFKR